MAHLAVPIPVLHEESGMEAGESSDPLSRPLGAPAARPRSSQGSTLQAAPSRGRAPSAPASSLPASPSTPAEPDGEEKWEETCLICSEPWTSTGEHRVAALRCGHLFGYTCIKRWVQGKGAKCPQSNQKCEGSNIVLLYAHKLGVDNREVQALTRDLEKVRSLHRVAELASAQYRLRLQVSSKECSRLRAELQELKALKAQLALRSIQSRSGTSASLRGHYAFCTPVLVSPAGGCRVMAFCESLGFLLASQPSPHSSPIPGFGVKTIGTATMKAGQYIPIHIKPIRGMALRRQQDGLLLSCALDNTLKLTSLLTNTVVQTYQTGVPVWSCCWCHDDNNYMYAGLTNGTVRVYDVRDTSTHVHELHPLGSRCPVTSLTYLPQADSGAFPVGGLLAGTLEGVCFLERENGSTYKPHMLPLEAGNCTDIQVEPESRHCLVTYGPGRSNPALRCVLLEMTRTRHASCSCCVVQTFTAGDSSNMLTKNTVFKHPAIDATLVCAGDKASRSTMVWHTASGSLLQKLHADLPVLDICPFQVNQTHFLASLTERTVKIYKWERRAL
ncbi:hypothetical protein ACEWY4_025834 [Coilia grayii]|uniref:RING-type E3 ubiquitin transferase n=1 Tax=Coilia grayii TaxID=363190 RepID=A0ABD1IT28_9TELE